MGFTGSKCLISTSVHEKDNRAGFIHHLDVYAFTYLAHLVLDIKVNPEIIPLHKVPQSAEPVDEFCGAGV